MSRITPFLWFDSNAETAINFYTSLFADSKIDMLQNYPAAMPGDLDGKVMMAEFTIANLQIKAFDAGPQFKFNPSISFTVSSNSEENVEKYWNALVEGGKVLMEFQEYPFSKKYGWLEDKFGLSWQISLGDETEKVTPSLLFTQDKFGKAEEAINLYTSLFPDSEVVTISRYGEDGQSADPQAINYSLFVLDGSEFIAMESELDHKFKFGEAISLFVSCKDQAEVDKYWNKLISDGGSEEPCGWLKDKYGVSWQIIPEPLGRLLSDPDREKADRVLQAMLKMKKIIVAELEVAYESK